MIAARFTDADAEAFSGRAAAFATKQRVRATAVNENAAEGCPSAAFFRSKEEVYFFFFLALVFAPDLATFAVFFFAAIVSTSPNSGMLIALRRFSKL
jgi:hypothetical protein